MFVVCLQLYDDRQSTEISWQAINNGAVLRTSTTWAQLIFIHTDSCVASSEAKSTQIPDELSAGLAGATAWLRQQLILSQSQHSVSKTWGLCRAIFLFSMNSIGDLCLLLTKMLHYSAFRKQSMYMTCSKLHRCIVPKWNKNKKK